MIDPIKKSILLILTLTLLPIIMGCDFNEPQWQRLSKNAPADTQQIGTDWALYIKNWHLASGWNCEKIGDELIFTKTESGVGRYIERSNRDD